MKASAIRIDVNELVKLERAEPPVAIATATIKFQITEDLSFLNDETLSRSRKEEFLKTMLMRSLKDIYLK